MVSTFISRRMSVEMDTAISLSRSLPWRSVPNGSKTPITLKVTDSIKILGVERMLTREEVSGNGLADECNAIRALDRGRIEVFAARDTATPHALGPF
jgi:hypothetical protein